MAGVSHLLWANLLAASDNKKPGRRYNSVQSALGSLRGSCPYAREALANQVRAHPGFRQDLHHAINFLSLLNGIKDVFDPYVNMLRQFADSFSYVNMNRVFQAFLTKVQFTMQR